jgi:Transglutaminase-like superfamily
VPGLTDYATAGPLTDLSDVDPVLLARIAGDPVDICRPAGDLVIQPRDATALGVPEARLDEQSVRPALRLVDALLALDRAPLDVPRRPERRVVGTCRHFAVLSCALLRHRGIPARARCGFATYFQPGRGVDHWITEYWRESDARWVRIDSEMLSLDVPAHPEDLRPGEFLTGGEAWAAFRAGEIDAALFGVYGTGNWGPAEIRGNAVRDVAALNKAEMLPWDEWGRMAASYRGETGADYDGLMDTIAGVCARDDPAEVAELYAIEELQVPAEFLR